MKRMIDQAEPVPRPRGRRARRLVCLLFLAASAFLLAGCAGEEAGAGDDLDRQVVSLKTEVPLRSPAYQPATGALLALTESGDGIVKLEVEEPEGGFFAGPDEQDPRLVRARGEDLEGGGAGENIALDRFKEGRAFVPQPNLDHVQSLQTDDLLDVRTFDAGERPARVAMSGPQDAIYALSADGTTVTSVDLGSFDVVAEKRVNGSRETLIETSPAVEDEFWLAGSEGVSAHAFGTERFPEGRISLDAAALAVDAEDAERAYASEAGTGRVAAVEPQGGDGLSIVAETDLGEEVLYLAAEPGRLYALTPGRLVALDAESLETIQTVELPSEGGEPNGIAVGEEGVFVTLEGERRVLLVAKPPAEE
ncbi:MAG: hypothetical protein M3R38_07845 [Actinomycetota bacterium]|nr:hypothetical protein [Actinomycetota bacterium]